MKQRDPIVATLLSIFVPFYMIYWLYVTGQELDRRGSKAPNLLLLFAPLLMIVVVLIGMLLSVVVDSGIGVGITILLYVIAFPLAFGATLYYYYKFSQAVERVTTKQLTTGVLFLLFWFVSPAAVYLIQEKLNAVQATAPATTGSPVPPTA